MQPSSKALKLLSLIVVLGLLVASMPPQVVLGQTNTITVITDADGYTSAAEPGTNFFDKTYLTVDNSPVIRSYIRFNVSGLNGAKVSKAVLRVYTLYDAINGLQVSKASSSNWTEETLTYRTAPTFGATIRSLKPFSANTWLDLDVTSAVTGEGAVTFVIKTSSYDAFTLASRERDGGAYAAQLVVSTSTAAAPTATKVPTQAPTATKAPTQAPTQPAPTATKVPTQAPTSAPVPASITVKANADAAVSASEPGTNLNGRTYLTVDNSPVIRSYIRFNVSGLNGAQINSASLRVYSLYDAPSGLQVSKANSSSWSEGSITYNNAPSFGSTIRSISSFNTNTWLNLDVTGAVTGEGDVTFVIKNPSYNAFTLASREREGGAYTAQLVLNTQGSSPSQPTTAPTTAPTRTPTTAPTTAPTRTPTTAPTSSPSNPMPLGVPGNWKLKFSDEFNSSSLDLNKWEPNWLAGNDTAITKPINGAELSCYDPAQVSVTGGNLKLSAVARSCRANNGTTYSYASGIVTSRPHYTFSYGYMEARVWLDGSSTIKNWPAFWADGTGQWPTTGEIDVFEGLNGRASWHYHYGTPSDHKQAGGYPTMSTQTGWHTFGANWQPGLITFYYDGKEVGKVTSGVVSGPMFLILNYGVSTQISPPVQVPSNFLVDYVRVWQQ